MVALPLSILAFAAGVYLLIKVKKEYLSSLFSVLAWFVIAASVASITVSCLGRFHGYHHQMCCGEGECRMEKQIIIKDGEGAGCHHMGESGGMTEGKGGCSMHHEGGMAEGKGSCSMHHEGGMAEGKEECCMGKEKEGKKGCCEKEKE